MNVLIVGGGQVSLEYIKVCSSLGYKATLACRSMNTEHTHSGMDYSFINDDVFNLSKEALSDFTHIIIAVQPRFTFGIVEKKKKKSLAQLLVEKPICMTSYEFSLIESETFEKRIYVAFNRRRFESVKAAKEMIKGKPILSMEISFTEMRDRRRGSEAEIKLWGMCNTIHLFDMAFYLAGTPSKIQAIRSTVGNIDSYNVTGVLPHGLVSMNAHWGGPGNWGISITTPDEKLYFDPLETLSVQSSGSFVKDQLRLEKSPNDCYKDGFFSQTSSFLNGDKTEFISYQAYKELALVVEKIFC